MQRSAIGLVLAALALVSVGSAAAGSAQAVAPGDALKTMHDAVNNGDAHRYASVYSASAIINIFGAGQLRGRAAIEQHEVELLAQFPGARFAFYDTWLDGDVLVAHYGVNAQTPAAMMGHEGLLVFTFNAAGEIERENRYLDSVTPMAQLGALSGVAKRAAPVLPSTWRRHDRTAAGAATEKRNVAAARAAVAALHGGRLSVATRALSRTLTIDEVMLTDTFTGADGGTRWLTTLAAFDDARFEIANIAGVGRHVVVEGILTGVISRPFGLLKPSPQRASAHRAAIFEFDDDGSITYVKAFMNGKELAESVDQWPPR
jgi:predicted ester cyclase